MPKQAHIIIQLLTQVGDGNFWKFNMFNHFNRFGGTHGMVYSFTFVAFMFWDWIRVRLDSPTCWYIV